MASRPDPEDTKPHGDASKEMPTNDFQATSLPPDPPIHILPADILSSIFMIFRKSILILPTGRMPTSVIISHVCQRWRDTSLSTPFLWNHIRVDSSPYHGATCEIYRESKGKAAEVADEEWKRQIDKLTTRTKVFISRSADVSLTVNITTFDVWDFRFSDNRSPERASAWLSPLVDALTQTTRRWEEASFTFDLLLWNAPFLSLPALHWQEFPRLRKLDFHMGLGNGRLTLDSKGLGILGLPTLETLSFLTDCRNFAVIPVCWSSLTHLSIGPPSGGPQLFEHQLCEAADALDVLRACSKLVSCRFTLEWREVDRDLITLPRIRLPFLESMALEGAPTHRGFASSLDLPALRTLVLDWRQEDSGGFEEWIDNFCSQLEDFTFNYGGLTPRDLYFCLPRIPNVVRLSVLSHANLLILPSTPIDERRATFFDFELAMLRPGETAEGVSLCCPKLEQFVCHPGKIEFAEASLLKFIIARTDPRILPDNFTLFKSVDLRFFGFQTMDVRKELEDSGIDMETLDLRISYHAVA